MTERRSRSADSLPDHELISKRRKSDEDFDIHQTRFSNYKKLCYAVHDCMEEFKPLREDQKRALPRLFSQLPYNLNPQDGMTLFKLLFQADLLGKFKYDWVDVEESTGRIIEFRFGCHPGWVNSSPFHLPPAIEELHHLKFLWLFNCRSIPQELGNLSHLEELRIQWCPGYFVDNIPEGLKLEKLKRFLIVGLERAHSEFLLMHGRLNPELLDSPVLAFTKFRLPSLETLRFIQIYDGDVRTILRSLNENHQNFHLSLRRLEFVNVNRIESIDGISKNDRAALLSVLDKFDRIYTLSAKRYTKPKTDYDPEIEYRLRINHAGRKYLSAKTPIRVELWPKIFERAYESSADIYDDTNCTRDEIESKKCATGLYHLLRNGPLLFSGDWFDRK